MKKTKYALVLSGGGFKGAFQLGVINQLAERWSDITGEQTDLHFDIVSGVSVGSLNGALIAMNKRQQLNDLWTRIGTEGVEMIYTSDFINTKSNGEEIDFKPDKLIELLEEKLGFWGKLGVLFSSKKRKKLITEIFTKIKAIADNTPLRNELTKLLDAQAIENNQCTYFCGFVDLDQGHYHNVSHRDFPSKEDFVNGVLASTAMPVIWEPVAKVQHNGSQSFNLIDGGIRNVSPLGDVIRAINDDTENDTEYVLFIINCSTGKNTKTDAKDYNIAKIALRSLYEIALTEVFNNDLEQFLRINDLVEQVKTVDPNFQLKNFDFPALQRTDTVLKSFKAVVIQPDIDLGDPLLATEFLINKRKQHGVAQAHQAIQKYLG